MSRTSAFEASVRAIGQAVRDGKPVPRDAFEQTQTVVVRFLHGRIGLRQHDAEDAAAEAVTRLVSAARDGTLDLNDRPGAYLLTIARRVAVDQWRRRGAGREQLTDTPAGEPRSDDEVARILDAGATGDRVQAALARAYEDDTPMSLIVRTWLDMASELGSAPSSRGVAERVGVSHTTVIRALDRFREYLR